MEARFVVLCGVDNCSGNWVIFDPGIFADSALSSNSSRIWPGARHAGDACLRVRPSHLEDRRVANGSAVLVALPASCRLVPKCNASAALREAWLAPTLAAGER